MHLGHKLAPYSGTIVMECPSPPPPAVGAEAPLRLLRLRILLLELCQAFAGRAVRGVRNDLQGFVHETETGLSWRKLLPTGFAKLAILL